MQNFNCYSNRYFNIVIFQFYAILVKGNVFFNNLINTVKFYPCAFIKILLSYYIVEIYSNA